MQWLCDGCLQQDNGMNLSPSSTRQPEELPTDALSESMMNMSVSHLDIDSSTTQASPVRDLNPSFDIRDIRFVTPINFHEDSIVSDVLDTSPLSDGED